MTVKDTLKNNLYFLKMIHQASPKRLMLTLIISVLEAVVTIFFDIYLLLNVVNAIQYQEDIKSIFIFILIVGVLKVSFIIFNNWYTRVFLPSSDQDIYKYIQKKVLSKASEVDITCFDDVKFYDKYIKTLSEASNRATEILDSIKNIVGAFIMVLTVSFVLFEIQPWLIVLAVTPFIIDLLFGRKLNKLRYECDMQIQEKSRVNAYVKRVFYMGEYAKELRLSNINKVLIDKFKTSTQSVVHIIKKYGWKFAVLELILTRLMEDLAYFGGILIVTYNTLVIKTVSVGSCFVVINSIGSVSYQIRNIADIILEFHSHSLYIENIKEFLEYTNKISENPEGIKINKTNSFVIQIKNVDFSYLSKDKLLLSNVNFTIKKGEKIAIVGENGAGKSTLVKLLMRLYNVTSGDILFNNHSISKYNLESYRSLFATVFQDYKLFALSVIQNILLKDNITEQEKTKVRELLKYIGIEYKFENLPKTYNSIMTKEFDENGVILSGGEMQKVAIARTVAQEGEIIILDEPSAALDAISEQKIYNIIMELCNTKTVLFISHRLSSVTLADKILLLENGRIAEMGTHNQLLNMQGRYAQMWEKQSKYYQYEDKKDEE